jgi:DNA polymerase
MSASGRQRSSASDYIPQQYVPPSGAILTQRERIGDLSCLSNAVQHCRGCELYRRATQAVFGEGDPAASVMIVGEQPGDMEDVEGHPFVGPAGALLDHIMEEAGIPREKTWLTNAVKHFKWSEGADRRLHERPTTLEVRACRPWLGAEIRIVQPRVIVTLGATAAQSLLGPDFRFTKQRGDLINPALTNPRAGLGDALVLPTWHPAAILRAPRKEDRHRMRAQLADDFGKLARGGLF